MYKEDDEVVRRYIQAKFDEHAREIIERLRNERAYHMPDHGSFWGEVKDQVGNGHSVFWESYLNEIWRHCSESIGALPVYEKDLLAITTPSVSLDDDDDGYLDEDLVNELQATVLNLALQEYETDDDNFVDDEIDEDESEEESSQASSTSEPDVKNLVHDAVRRLAAARGAKLEQSKGSSPPQLDIDWKENTLQGTRRDYFNNEWREGELAFNVQNYASQLNGREGIVPLEAMFSSRVGSEIVLFLIDRTPFMTQLLAERPFNFFLRPGFARTGHGYLVFLFFYSTPPTDPQRLLAGWTLYLDPFAPETHEIFWRLAYQTHWHLIFVGAGDKITDLQEFENRFRLEEAMDTLEVVPKYGQPGNFKLATAEFENEHPIESMFNEYRIN